MNPALATIPARFDALLEQSREAYLASPTGKARKAIAKAHRCTSALTDRLNHVSTAMTVGAGTDRACRDLNDALLDLRIACGDVEALIRLAEAS